MPLDSGTITFRVFENDSAASADELIAGLRSYLAPPLDKLEKDPIAGWCSTRFIGDNDVSEETCKSGRFVRAQLIKAEKKIPSALLKVYCKMEEITEMKARGVKFLNRATRAEIKERIAEELLPQMPPTLSAIQMVHDTESNRAYATATSDKQHDAFCVGYNRATRLKPVALGPESAAERMFQINVSEFEPQCFSPEEEEVLAVADEVGMDFLTWLWHFWETGDGEFKPAQGGKVGLMLEGPAVFHHEGGGAHEISVRRGLPLQSREAKAALLSGKKLKSVKLTMTRGEDVFSSTVNGRDFSFSSLKLALDRSSDADKYDPETNFQNRVNGMKFYTDTFFQLYGVFLKEITAPKTWEKTLDSMREWIANREELA